MSARIAICLFIAAGVAAAQSVLAPTPDRPAPSTEAGGYSISNSFESGYRFASVGGARDVYDSSVNFGNGFRLFEADIRVHSLDGRGKWLDELAFNGRGAATDPYQSYVLRAFRRKLYRYDLQVRRTEYANRLPALWEGEHGLRTERLLQSHELTLLPDSRFEILLGYDRNKRTGPGFFSQGIPSAEGAFDSSNFIRLAQEVRQQNNQYRAGFNLRAFDLAVTATQAFDDYKDDTTYADASDAPGLLPNVQPVDSLTRSEPFHGNTHITQVAVRTAKERWIGFQGGFVYSTGSRRSFLSESVAAAAANGGATLRQTFVFGDASRSQGSGEFTVTLLPSPKWTITHTVSANNMRIDGSSDFLEVSSFRNQFLEFEHLGVRHISNASEANYRPIRQLGFYGAYRHSTRRVRTRSFFPDFDFEEPLLGIDNEVDVGAAGVRWTPDRSFRASFDFEVGRADQPFTPVSPRRFHNQRVQLRWRRGALTASAFFKNDILNNEDLFTRYNADRRSAGAHGSWNDSSGNLTVDGGYTWLHADSVAGIFNLIDPNAAAQSIYESNLHTANVATRFRITDHAAIYVAYIVAKDVGDDRDNISIAEGLTPTYPFYSFDSANFFVSLPLTYQSPQTRLSVALSDRISWNVGWRFYSYEERFSFEQDYRAHVGYSSLRWYF